MNVNAMKTNMKETPRFKKLVFGITVAVSFFTLVLYLTSDGLKRRPTVILDYYVTFNKRVSFVSLWGTWKDWPRSVDWDDKMYAVSEKVYRTSPFDALDGNYDHLNTSERRLATMNDVCRYYRLDQEESFFKNMSNKSQNQGRRSRCSLIVDEPSSLAFCFIPKVGCTNFKRYFLNESGFNYSTARDLHGFSFKKLKMVSPAFFAPNQTSSYKKAMFTRHPFRRLVSAYYNKLYNPFTRESHYKAYAVPIMKRYRGKDLNVKMHPRLTFEEFVDYLIETPPSHYDVHWIPFWARCEPCRVKYDFLGRMETMNHDTESLFHTRFSTYDHPTDDTDALSLFAQIPLEKKVKLYEIYRLDFELFGYSVNEYL